MTLWTQLMDAARRMLREPREAAAELCDLDVSRDVLLMALVAVMAVSVIVTEPMLAMASSVFEAETLPPLVRAIGSTLGGMALVWVVWKMGEMFGGTGTFNCVLINFVVLEAVFVIGIAGLLVLMALMPAAAGLAGLGFVFYWLWMFANALAEVHKFPSAWKAFGIVVAAWVIVNYAGVLLMGLVSGVAGGPSNV